MKSKRQTEVDLLMLAITAETGTQDAFASKIGFSRQNLNHIIRQAKKNEGKLNPNFVKKLAEQYDIDIYDWERNHTSIKTDGNEKLLKKLADDFDEFKKIFYKKIIDGSAFPTIYAFLIHLFGNEIEQSFQYLQNLLFFKDKNQAILCLTSDDNNSGKSFFTVLLKILAPRHTIDIGPEYILPSRGYIYVLDQKNLTIDELFRRLNQFPGINIILITNSLSGEKEADNIWKVKVPKLDVCADDFIERMISERAAFLSYLKN